MYRAIMIAFVLEPQMRLADNVKVFKGLEIKKATGSEGLSLKTFAEELACAWVDIFQRSLDSHIIPDNWKKSIIIPVSKKHSPEEYNDYVPVTSTCIVMKCLEGILVWKLLDPFQFAH